jgi:hypothetical protein
MHLVVCSTSGELLDTDSGPGYKLADSRGHFGEWFVGLGQGPC